MACSIMQPSEGEEELAVVVENFEPGGGGPKGVRRIFKAMTQVVLLFGVETWVLTTRMEQALRSFQHRVAQWLTGRHLRRRGDGSWE